MAANQGARAFTSSWSHWATYSSNFYLLWKMKNGLRMAKGWLMKCNPCHGSITNKNILCSMTTNSRTLSIEGSLSGGKQNIAIEFQLSTQKQAWINWDLIHSECWTMPSKEVSQNKQKYLLWLMIFGLEYYNGLEFSSAVFSQFRSSIAT